MPNNNWDTVVFRIMIYNLQGQKVMQLQQGKDGGLQFVRATLQSRCLHHQGSEFRP